MLFIIGCRGKLDASRTKLDYQQKETHQDRISMETTPQDQIPVLNLPVALNNMYVIKYVCSKKFALIE